MSSGNSSRKILQLSFTLHADQLSRFVQHRRVEYFCEVKKSKQGRIRAGADWSKMARVTLIYFICTVFCPLFFFLPLVGFFWPFFSEFHFNLRLFKGFKTNNEFNSFLPLGTCWIIIFYVQILMIVEIVKKSCCFR